MKANGSCFIGSTWEALREECRKEVDQQQTTVLQRIPESCIWVYWLAQNWVKNSEDNGQFAIREQEWNTLIKEQKGWATTSVIQLPATVLTCALVI